MKAKEDFFKKFQSPFSKMEEEIHIIKLHVSAEQQMDYFRFSDQIREELKRVGVKPDLKLLEESLYDPDVTEGKKKHNLSVLANLRDIKAFRILENILRKRIRA